MEPKTKKTIKLIIIIAAVASLPVLIFIGTIIWEWQMDAKMHKDQPVFGSVNGDEIRFADYMDMLQQEIDNLKETYNKDLTGKELEQVKDAVWSMLVKQKIIDQQVKLNKIEITDETVEDIMFKNPGSLPDEVKVMFNDSTGNFDIQNYIQTMNTYTPEVEKFKEKVKLVIKYKLEVNELFDIITKDVKLTDEDYKSAGNSDKVNELLMTKKNSEVLKWLEDLKLKAVIVDNRKKFVK